MVEVAAGVVPEAEFDGWTAGVDAEGEVVGTEDDDEAGWGGIWPLAATDDVN